jgi:hypothetical protein
MENSGTKYVHWGVMIAMAVLMVLWFLKCGYPWKEGMNGRNQMGSYAAQMSAKLGTVGANQTSANVRFLEQDQVNFQPSVSLRTGMPGVQVLGGGPDFGASKAQRLAMQSGFLSAPQSPWVPAPESQYTGHSYLEAVHLKADEDAAIKNGSNLTLFDGYRNKINGFIGGLEAWELEGAVGGRHLRSDSAGPGLADGFLEARLGK